MGEEEKKPEEKKTEEKMPPEEGKKTGEEKKEEAKPAEEKKQEKKADAAAAKDSKETPPPPPPPQEIILRVFMHCEGCAKKVRRCLKGFEGVEDVVTDCKSSKVIVKGDKADPLKVLERVQKKSHRQVELLSPIPKPPAEDKKVEEKEKPKAEEKKEVPQVITVVLKVHMHCEACAQEIKKRILRMKGVESAEPDLKGSQVTVKGVLDPPTLVEYVYKKTGKHAVIVKQEPEKKEVEDKGKDVKEEKKGGGGEGDKEKKGGGEEEKKEKKEGGEGEGEGAKTEEGGGEQEAAVMEVKRNEYSYYPPKYAMEYYAYPPQIFSDENPNACSVM